MKFDMHCHTQEGSADSKVSIEEYMQLLIQKGFDGMLVTDHDSYRAYKYYQKHLKHKYPNFVVLKGVEYDTVDAGHFLVVMPQGVHLKVLEIKGMTLRFLIHLVHKHGGILGPAHPCGGAFLSIYSTGVYRYKKNISKKFDFLEGYNACEKLEINQAAARIARKYGKPIFGGSDAHRQEAVGLGYTKIDAEIRNEDDLIQAVKAGVKISCGGQRFLGTLKHRMGKWGELLVVLFFAYNIFGAVCNWNKIRYELKVLLKR